MVDSRSAIASWGVVLVFITKIMHLFLLRHITGISTTQMVDPGFQIREPLCTAIEELLLTSNQAVPNEAHAVFSASTSIQDVRSKTGDVGEGDQQHRMVYSTP